MHVLFSYFLTYLLNRTQVQPHETVYIKVQP